MKVILISGHAGCGKNQVASYIRDNVDKTIITGFSKYIKLMAREMTSWNGSEDDKPRTFLQTMGDKFRAIDKDILVKRMLEDIIIYKEYYNCVVISDVRLEEEINYFKKNSTDDVITIRVNCQSNGRRKLTKKEQEHQTEKDLDNYKFFDYVINNNYDENLKKEVLKIIEKENLK